MTHAMFMKGAPDPFRDTAGGDFDTLDAHLAHVRRHHPEVAFATASEAVLEFLDYYSPTPRAVLARPRFRSTDGRTWRYPIRVLGRGIPLSPARPLPVAVTAPAACEVEELECLTVLENGRPIAHLAPSGTSLPRIEFAAAARDGYELEVRLAGAAAADGEERIDEPLLDLLRLPAPGPLRAAVAREGHPRPGDNWEWDAAPRAVPAARAPGGRPRRSVGPPRPPVRLLSAGRGPARGPRRVPGHAAGRGRPALAPAGHGPAGLPPGAARGIGGGRPRHVEARFSEGARECAQMRITLAG